MSTIYKFKALKVVEVNVCAECGLLVQPSRRIVTWEGKDHTLWECPGCGALQTYRKGGLLHGQ